MIFEYKASCSAILSVEQSSTTITSSGLRIWFTMDASALPMRCALLKHGMMTLTELASPVSSFVVGGTMQIPMIGAPGCDTNRKDVRTRCILAVRTRIKKAVVRSTDALPYNGG